MWRFLGIYFLFFQLSFSQTNINANLKQESNDKTEYLFDPTIVKHQLDSLNKLTPLNLVYNKTVAQHIKFYLFQRPEQVSKLLALSEYYFPIFESLLDKNTLPLEIKYLPIIESSLNPQARSYAGAVGLWQFMYLTAKEYGLRINSYLDERKDPHKSTQAACDYLRKAYKTFNNWDLAISAYNAGSRNIKKAIRRSGGKTNYWELRPFLPKETRNYLPSFIAAVYVMHFAKDYGIEKDINYIISNNNIDSVYLNEIVKIDHLAKLLDLELETLEKLNPVYRIKFVPSLNSEKFPIFLPKNKIDQFLEEEDTIYAELRRMALAEEHDFPPFTEIEKITYIIKKGDYLGKIAAKYNCTVKDIMLWNDLKTHKINSGKRISIYRTVK